jgi:folate-binding protein YgfZ
VSAPTDPAYAAATEDVAVFDRRGRGRLSVRGRAPAQMLNGVLTGTIPSGPAPTSEEVLGGTATYHAVLTPKGKMITDLWCLRLGDEETAGYLLDVPAAGHAGLAIHLSRYLPPRLARVEDVTADTGSIAVVGPEAAALLSRLVLGLRVDAAELSALDEGAWRCVGRTVPDGIVVRRSADVLPEAFVLTGPGASVEAARAALVAAGARPGTPTAWTTLRVEAARPEYGTDMDDATIPVEAGIHDRAIDYGKGCYTGQEVIVRIRDRGHVNRHLRQLLLGEIEPPAPGTPLVVEGRDKPVGAVTSAVRSPRFGQTVALGWVRRGVEETPRPAAAETSEPPTG